MRITVDIPEQLMREAHRAAESEGITLDALVEEGLRSVLSQRARRQPPLPDTGMDSASLREHAHDPSTEASRSLALTRLRAAAADGGFDLDLFEDKNR